MLDSFPTISHNTSGAGHLKGRRFFVLYFIKRAAENELNSLGLVSLKKKKKKKLIDMCRKMSAFNLFVIYL